VYLLRVRCEQSNEVEFKYHRWKTNFLLSLPTFSFPKRKYGKVAAPGLENRDKRPRGFFLFILRKNKIVNTKEKKGIGNAHPALCGTFF
jgi:hypothetical protein